MLIQTAEDLRALIVQRNLRQVKVGLYDQDGAMTGKYMARDKFLSALSGGFKFCDVVFGWDVENELYDNTQLVGWQWDSAHAEYCGGYARAWQRGGLRASRDLNMNSWYWKKATKNRCTCRWNAYSLRKPLLKLILKGLS